MAALARLRQGQGQELGGGARSRAATMAGRRRASLSIRLRLDLLSLLLARPRHSGVEGIYMCTCLHFPISPRAHSCALVLIQACPLILSRICWPCTGGGMGTHARVCGAAQGGVLGIRSPARADGCPGVAALGAYVCRAGNSPCDQQALRFFRNTSKPSESGKCVTVLCTLPKKCGCCAESFPLLRVFLARYILYQDFC